MNITILTYVVLLANQPANLPANQPASQPACQPQGRYIKVKISLKKPWGQCFKLFTVVIYCLSMVIPSYCIKKRHCF
jgi:hypothetical protein